MGKARLRGNAQVPPARQDAGVDRLRDCGDRHAEFERRLGRPAPGSLLLGLVHDLVDQRGAGFIRLAQNLGGDLYEVGIERARLPVREHIADVSCREAIKRFEDVVGLGDQLHVRVFDAVVHHLDVMAGAVGSDQRAAGAPRRLRRHFRQERRNPLISGAIAARHHARAFERALLAAGNAHADEADPPRRTSPGPPHGVGEQGIAGVDENVVGLQMGRQLVDDVIHRLARLDHDDEDPRRPERPDEFREALRRDENPLAAVLPHQFVGAFRMAVVQGDGEPMACRVASEIGAHNRQSKNPKIGFRRFCHLPSPWRGSMLGEIPPRRC